MRVVYCFMMYLVMNHDSIAARQETLLIFLDTPMRKLDDAAGMNVAHQLLTALIQKAAPVLVAQELWNHIIQRRQRYLEGIKKPQSLHCSVKKLIDEINQNIQNCCSLDTMNSSYNETWYQKNYSDLAQLSTDAAKAVFFDYFCACIVDFLGDWLLYRASTDFIVGIPKVCKSSLVVKDLSLLKVSDALHVFNVPQRHSFISIMNKLLSTTKTTWNIYLTGHGYHEGQEYPCSLVAGLTIDEFRSFLLFLNNQISTHLLVYNCCYSGGIHLIEPYHDQGKDLLLRYAVYVTCLTDAPVYVSGVPAGIKLPPYSATNLLCGNDVIQGVGLSWFLLQNFNKFVRYAEHDSSSEELIKSITEYQKCEQDVCRVTILENMPLVRKPRVAFFVPVDVSYLALVLHGTHRYLVKDKTALLWYIKQFLGTLIIRGRIPQFISMIPGDGVTYIARADASMFALNDFLTQAFFSIDDPFLQQIFLFKELQINHQQLSHVMVMPTGSWNPAFIPTDILGFCAYRAHKQWHCVVIDHNKKIKEQSISLAEAMQLEKLWDYVYQESMLQVDCSPDQLLGSRQYYERMQQQQNILKDCIQTKVCKPSVETLLKSQ